MAKIILLIVGTDARLLCFARPTQDVLEEPKSVRRFVRLILSISANRELARQRLNRPDFSVLTVRLKCRPVVIRIKSKFAIFVSLKIHDRNGASDIVFWIQNRATNVGL